MKSLTARVVAFAVLVALASALLTAYVSARALGDSNREQAATTLVTAADSFADAVAAGRLQDKLDARGALRRLGATFANVPVGRTRALPVPFTAADVASAAPGVEPHESVVAGVTWLVVGRPAGVGRVGGDRVALVGAKLSAAVQLTPAQRRRAVLAGALGLLGGALAGLLLARGITRPLGRLAAAARRMSAGERDLAVAVGGPREVTDVAEALAGLSRALAASEARQRSFLMSVSHELRTPLTAVVGYAEAIADGALPASEVAHAAAVIRDESGRLQRRVDDLLALARLEADDFRISPAPADVGALLRAAALAWRPRAEAAGVLLRVEAPEAGPWVTTDGERLRQAVDALADNALRLLPSGAPLVLACRALAVGSGGVGGGGVGGDGVGGGGVRVEVRDGGPGLAADDLAVAFERGRLTERYRGARPVGSGLGLALVGELARRLGGRAEAVPAPEGGVAFCITLPPGPP